MAAKKQNRNKSEPMRTPAGDNQRDAACPAEPVHHDHVACAAYYLAERRGFAPGHELDDWLAAEARVAAGTQEKPADPGASVERDDARESGSRAGSGGAGAAPPLK